MLNFVSFTHISFYFLTVEVSVRTALASPPPASSPSPTPPETPVPHTMSPDTVPHTMSPADTEHVSLTSQVSLHNNLQLDAEPQVCR